MTFFSIVFVITLKAKARIQAQLGANNNAVATEKASVESHAQAPHEVNMDINENVAYGIPVHFIHEKGN